jgi:hypothetical protein
MEYGSALLVIIVSQTRQFVFDVSQFTTIASFGRRTPDPLSNMPASIKDAIPVYSMIAVLDKTAAVAMDVPVKPEREIFCSTINRRPRKIIES